MPKYDGNPTEKQAFIGRITSPADAPSALSTCLSAAEREQLHRQLYARHLRAWAQFETWCGARSICPLAISASDLSAFYADLGETSTHSKILDALHAISTAHRLRDIPDPIWLPGVCQAMHAAQDRVLERRRLRGRK